MAKKETGLGEITRRGDAFAYLHALLTKSNLFKEEMNKLRESLDLSIIGVIDENLASDAELIAHFRLKHELDNNTMKLIRNKEFVSFCHTFYLSKYFYKDIARIVLGLDFNEVFNSSISTYNSSYYRSKDLYSFTYKEHSLVPPAFIKVPINFLTGDLKEVKSIIVEAQQRVGDYFTDVHLWDAGTVFDRAYLAYKLTKVGYNPEQRRTEVISKLNLDSRGMGEYFEKKIQKEIKIIERQIARIQNYKYLLSQNFS